MLTNALPCACGLLPWNVWQGTQIRQDLVRYRNPGDETLFEAIVLTRLAPGGETLLEALELALRSAAGIYCRVLGISSNFDSSCPLRN
jgi:hypothetical protein